MRRAILALLAASAIAGCEVYTPATPEAITAARYVESGPAVGDPAVHGERELRAVGARGPAHQWLAAGAL